MANPNAIVSQGIRLEPPLDRPVAELLRAEAGLTVVLDGDRRVRLDPGNERSAGFAQLLDQLQKRNAPVYVEIDPESTAITRLLIPHVTRVLDVAPIDDETLGIVIDRSHARHVLRRGSADFEELESKLKSAKASRNPVILTEDEAHEVLDLRDFRPGPEGFPPPFPRPEPLPKPFWLIRWIRKLFCFLCCWWWWWCRCVSEAKAQQAFDAMNSTSCDPLSVPPPCIPFLYPDDGCWGRAHEMCRLMLGMGLKPRKVWIQGSLQVATKNNPNCAVYWGWHVAPTLCVRGPGLFQRQDKVIDPALFTTPVTKSTWKGVQGDPNATLTDSAASIFYLWGNVTDPTYTQTNQVLATYRGYLQARSIQLGPPPYAYCP